MQGVFAIGCTVLLSCSSGNKNLPAGEDYIKEINAWDRQRVENLKGENGWLNVAGRFTMMPGQKTVGADSANHIVFPAGKAPAHMGYFIVQDSAVHFVALPGTEVYAGGKLFSTGVIFKKGDVKGVVLSHKSLRWFVIERSGRFILRLRDFESDELKNFTHIDRYPVDESWRIEAEFEPVKEKKNITFENVIGTTTEMEFMGTLSFERNGEKYTLNAVLDEDLFIVFADSTTGKETYRGGRMLHAAIPKKGEKVILDFNKAYNPPCAFTDFATCPLPPKENILPLRVEAGEKNYGKH